MRTSTGFLAILVAALLAAASISSPTRLGGWQEARDSSRPCLWQVAVEQSGLEPSRWQDSGAQARQMLPDPLGMLQAWLFRPMERLGMEVW